MASSTCTGQPEICLAGADFFSTLPLGLVRRYKMRTRNKASVE